MLLFKPLIVFEDFDSTRNHRMIDASRQAPPLSEPPLWDVVIIGTGFAGLAMAQRLQGQGTWRFVVLERAERPGGTWRDNRYPGCHCDVPSHLYSLSGGPAWDWSRKYASQAEIEAYLTRVAAGLSMHIRYRSPVGSAHFDEVRLIWRVLMESGQTLECRFLVAGLGPLGVPAYPALPGLETFPGRWWHSARWPVPEDGLTGARVALVGSGASAVQIAPAILPRCRSLHLFQRTPGWVVEKGDRVYDDAERRHLREIPGWRQWHRAALYWQSEVKGLAFRHRRLMEVAQTRARQALEQAVPDPVLRAQLIPDHAMGCKRILLSDDYLACLQDPRVTLVPEGLTAIEGAALCTPTARHEGFEAVIFATGFRHQDNPEWDLFSGIAGVTLTDLWRQQRSAYLGIMVPQMPNLFLLTGPYSGLGHNSIVFMIEAQIDWILSALRHTLRHRARAIALEPAALERFTAEMNQRSRGTVWTSGCHSWYLDGQHRNTALWPGSSLSFWWRCQRFRDRDVDWLI